MKNFTQIQNELIRSNVLTPADKSILFLILSYNPCFISKKTISEITGLSLATVKRSLNKMKELRLLTWQKGKCRGQSNLYKVATDLTGIQLNKTLTRVTRDLCADQLGSPETHVTSELGSYRPQSELNKIKNSEDVSSLGSSQGPLGSPETLHWGHQRPSNNTNIIIPIYNNTNNYNINTENKLNNFSSSDQDSYDGLSCIDQDRQDNDNTTNNPELKITTNPIPIPLTPSPIDLTPDDVFEMCVRCSPESFENELEKFNNQNCSTERLKEYVAAVPGCENRNEYISILRNKLFKGLIKPGSLERVEPLYLKSS